MFLKAIAWTWLVIVFGTITGLSLWQVVTNFAGIGGFFGFLWIFIVFMGSLVLAVAVITHKRE